MLSKSLIQFSVGGEGCVPSLLFDLRPNFGGGDGDNGDLLRKVPCSHCYTQCPLPCGRPPPSPMPAGDSWTPRAGLGQPLAGYRSLLLGPGVHKVLFVRSKPLFPQSCVSSVHSMVGWWRPPPRGLCHIRVYCTQSPCPCGRPLLPLTSARDTQTQFWLRLCGVSGSWCAQCLFEPSEHLWWAWGLILNVISPLLPSYWDFSLAVGCGVSFFWWDPTSPVNGCSAASCHFGVLAGEDGHMSFYSTILESKISLLQLVLWPVFWYPHRQVLL